MPLDVGIEELADGAEIPAQGSFIAASCQLHVGLAHPAIVSPEAEWPMCREFDAKRRMGSEPTTFYMAI